jgi:6-phosphofructokinase
MQQPVKRIALNFGSGYVPGLNAVVTGAVLAAHRLGWDVVGIQDGFEGLLFPERYPDGGLVSLSPKMVENLSGAGGPILGTAARNDPFHVRAVNAENQVEEVDRSADILDAIQRAEIDAVVSVVDSQGLSILHKLNRKGLRTVAIPKSVENDVAATMLSFGFNSTLSFAVEMLDRARQAARSARQIGVVELLGKHAGWLALQAGMAVCADAVLIPEIPYDLVKVAAKLRGKAESGEPFGLVVVAEGAIPAESGSSPMTPSYDAGIKATLSPLASGRHGAHALGTPGHAAETVALGLLRLTDQETYPLVIGQLVKGGLPTAVDRQLGLGYGAGAVRALNDNMNGVMVVFQPPDLKFVPISEALNRVRRVPMDSEFVQIARALDISLGD